jgi:DNA polymerase I-like protein with 3'-5' exonuclease and polymerase domains
MIGRHSQEAWGHRLGELKGTFNGPWDAWSEDMKQYCIQDVLVCKVLLQRIYAKGMSEEAIDLEHQVATIVSRQERYGVMFDMKAAEVLYAQLLKRQRELEKALATAFPAWTEETVFIPKRGNKTKGYVANVPVIKKKTVEFNPASRTHIVKVLGDKYGWKPTLFTDGGTPQMDESVLEHLKYPEIPDLIEYLLVLKRIGQLAEGKEAWMTHVGKDGRIRGRVNTNGAVTRRMTHSSPNLAQVPRVGSPYGIDCRRLFIAPPGRVLVGADASGLELRCLSHYLATFDNGAYAKHVVEGDVHTFNQQTVGLPTRDQAKTFIYAFIYGAGDEKLGTITGGGAASGRKNRETFLRQVPALAQLKEAVDRAVRERGALRCLDNGTMKVRSQHSALNTLIQGAGAIVMKKALVCLDDILQRAHLIPGKDYEFVLNIHDEWQIECRPDIAKFIGESAKNAINIAGQLLDLKCPMAGEYKVGQNWAETH